MSSNFFYKWQDIDISDKKCQCPVCNKSNTIRLETKYFDESIECACGGGDEYGQEGRIYCTNCKCMITYKEYGDNITEMLIDKLLQKWNKMYSKRG